MTRKPAGFRPKHRWLLFVGAALLLVLAALGVAVSIALSRLQPILRAAIVEKLGEHFHARVELDSFHVSLVNGLWAEGKGLRIWPPAQVVGVAVPAASTASPPGPLIRIAEFRFHAPLHYRLGEPIRISVIELNGLIVDVPPRVHLARAASERNPSRNPELGGPRPGPSEANGSGTGSSDSSASGLLRFQVKSVDCRNARLTLETSKPGKLPLEFDIARIKLTDIDSEAGLMHFDAQLTNPRPEGTILTSGSLGPWIVDDPGETRVAGSYHFEHADLSVFKGIAGILDSTGDYQGVLRGLEVDGQTQTPDFRLTRFGVAVPLYTHFHAQVDGTDGDTVLQPVDATLGKSRLTAVGQIVGRRPEALQNGSVLPGGRSIDLNVNVDSGRIEDFLRLASRSGEPLLTGGLMLKTSLDIPPGAGTVLERMKLKGNFSLDDAEFSSPKIQKWIGELSLRGQGLPKQAKDGSVAGVRSAMRSDFQIDDENVMLPNLQYDVPGARIEMKGTYGIDGGTLDFAGVVRTEATVSQMVGGWKGLLLRPADRLFEKNGAGTQVRIHVGGTRQDPKFGVDLDPMKHTSPAIPGQP